ncbi:whey acidic protein-like isoform X2 [Rana temporaria]|uniref:whey acidic protein-like isoform X2 n=1 Tax=Rana temporaria TaxID=8407 RepID=UPI001AACA5E6|nr:whey acidic protein-like isoform X2 [Rana temporaria]
MASVGLPILLALILCTVCTGTIVPSSAPPLPPDLIPVCPAFNSSICIYAKPGPPQCHNDSQCTDSKKCCCVNCGLVCKTPDRVRAGRCPDIKAKCRPEPTFNCTSDSDCPGTKKCCKICGRTCWDPAPEPAGVCPRNDGSKSGSLQCHSVKCSRDSDCKMGEKCCASGEGQSCVKPFTVKPGKCPSGLKIFCKRDDYTCKSDNDCSGVKKCCGICGMNCWNPEPEAAGKDGDHS